MLNVLNGIVDMLCNSMPAWNMMLLESQSELRKLEIARDKELVAAETAIDDGDITARLYNDIVIITEGNYKDEELLMAKAKVTLRWVKYTFYYLTEDAALIIADTEAQKLCNGIAKLVFPEAGKIYPKADDANLSKYDAEKLPRHYGGNFILNIRDIEEKFTDDLKMKAAAKYAEVQNNPNMENSEIPSDSATVNISKFERVGRYDEDGYFHPFFFSSPEEIREEYQSKPVKAPDMPDELFTKFEAALSKVAADLKYYYEKNQYGNWTINVIQPDMLAASSYMLDDGTIMGGDAVYIMGKCQGANGLVDSVFVKSDLTDIVSKILHNGFYIMSQGELDLVNSVLLDNQIIYHTVDFVGMKQLDMTALKGTQFNKALFNAVQLVPSDCRLRFESFTDLNHFILVSDINCISPMGYDNTTANKIYDGLKISIDNNFLLKKNEKGQVEKYLIG